jgi:glycine cleavage system H protein
LSASYLVPDGLLYTKDHEWVRITGNTAIIGVTDYAAKTLNDVVYLTLPPAGHEVKQFESFGTVESIKAVSELYSPFTGTMTRSNPELANHPELVNVSPYESGWIIEVSLKRLDEEKKNLLTPAQYKELVRSLAEEHH